MRARHQRQDGAVAAVDAFPISGPFPILRIVAGECRALKDIPGIEVHPIDNRDFVAILEVLSDAVERDTDRDAMRIERFLWADAGQHQQLRRVERAAREDHLALRHRLRHGPRNGMPTVLGAFLNSSTVACGLRSTFWPCTFIS